MEMRFSRERRLVAGALLAVLSAGSGQIAWSQDDGGTDLTAGTPDQVYRVGPGDILDVSVYDEDDLTRLVTIQHGGEISFPLIGDVDVAGSTVKEVQQRLTELLARDFLVKPQVIVKVKEYRSQWVTLVGEVIRPGKYYLEGPKTLLGLLTEAGGFTAEASGEVIMSRLTGTYEDGSMSRSVVLSREMPPEEQKKALSLPLTNGELITVPSQAFIYISGEVNRPGSYPLTAGLTVLEAVSLSGGLSKFGSKGKVEILRKTDSGTPERIRVDLGDIESGEEQDIPLVAGDIINVGRRIF
jgi:polysaccharide export outer membrane protein